MYLVYAIIHQLDRDVCLCIKILYTDDKFPSRYVFSVMILHVFSTICIVVSYFYTEFVVIVVTFLPLSVVDL